MSQVELLPSISEAESERVAEVQARFAGERVRLDARHENERRELENRRRSALVALDAPAVVPPLTAVG